MEENTYPDTLLWVSHNAGRGKAKSDRHKVFSHIQSGYNKWRRVEAARSMRKSVIIPRFQKAHDQAEEPSRGPKDPRSSPSSLTLKREDHDKLLLQRIVTFCGNSDPFTSTPVHVTARINDLLTFERRQIFPVIQGPGQSSQANVLPSWAAFTSGVLSSSLKTFAFLTRTAIVMAGCSQASDYLTLSLVYRQKGLRLLQSHIQQYGHPPFNVVMHMLVADIWAADFANAKPHLIVSRAMMERQLHLEPSTIVSYQWISILQMDIHRAAMSLTPTIFPMEDWLSAPFRTSLPPVETDLDSCLDGVLRTYFLELQYLTHQFNLLLSASSPSLTTWHFLRTRTLLLIGRALNHAIDGEDIAASLAVAYVARLTFALENVPMGHATIYNAGPMLLSRMSDALVFETLSSTLALWVLYVAALSGDRAWTLRFATHAASMNLKSWATCSKVLSKLYLPRDEPGVHFHAMFDSQLSKIIEQLKGQFFEDG